ncbi:hypothetical protein GWK47_022143 [Chionoecetes opilio]|uniref:Tudor domain-containing protein n=1 Tax=Chionoecetes opilio TaxID=41210 RepID=A0A8J4XN45_CHIOP|nr:hypothetical protein GWK47_022143 [Chionoecetes opilio]
MAPAGMTEAPRAPWRHLEICQVEDASTMWVREVPSQACSEELLQFLEMEKQMNHHFKNKRPQDQRHASLITMGNHVVVRYKDTWARGKVEKLPQARREKATVFLLDYGLTYKADIMAIIPLHKEEWTSVPCQAKKIALHAVVPVSLQYALINQELKLTLNIVQQGECEGGTTTERNSGVTLGICKSYALSDSNQDQHRALSRRTRTLLGRDKERYVRSLAEDVEGHLNANDLRPAYRALKKLRSKSPSRASAIRTADGRLVSDMDGQMAHWAEYFGQLFTVDPPTEQLHTTGLQAMDADPPIDETAPSLDEVREAVAKLKGGKAAGVCNISAELLKAGVIFAESLEVLVMALEALHEEAKPLGLEVSWLKTKVQVFGDLLDEAVQRCNLWDASATDFVKLLASKKPQVEFTPMKHRQEGKIPFALIMHNITDNSLWFEEPHILPQKPLRDRTVMCWNRDGAVSVVWPSQAGEGDV